MSHHFESMKKTLKLNLDINEVHVCNIPKRFLETNEKDNLENDKKKKPQKTKGMD